MFERMGRHPLAILLGAGVGLVALAALLLAALGGPVPAAATIGGHWSMVRDDGMRVSDRDFRGRYMLLFFGYTACHDICPPRSPPWPTRCTRSAAARRRSSRCS